MYHCIKIHLANYNLFLYVDFDTMHIGMVEKLVREALKESGGRDGLEYPSSYHVMLPHASEQSLYHLSR